uniref:Uncharacterized protein n=1 Tax=viral metagenome TaxID=1070528 RepID=A0A6C0HI23_9ZZZZ
MAKKQITWLELVKQKLNARKAKGEHPSISDVATEAKKDWISIKAGTHALYEQGKSKFFGKKKTKKTQKVGKKNKKGTDVASILSHIKLCPKCKKTVKKALGKRMKKGGDEPVEEEQKRYVKEEEEVVEDNDEQLSQFA